MLGSALKILTILLNLTNKTTNSSLELIKIPSPSLENAPSSPDNRN